MAQGTSVYMSDPKKYSFLEPLHRWPWNRVAYALAIDRLMAAGARSVSLDLIFDSSGTDVNGDQALQQSLQKHAGRITLAAQYEESQILQKRRWLRGQAFI